MHARRLIALFVLILVLFSGVTTEASSHIKINLNGENVIYDQSPVIVNGTTLVPMRGIFESLGATITWNSESKTVTGIKDNNEIKLIIGSTGALKNGDLVQLSQPAQIINGHTMVPLRFISESLGAEVAWDSSSKTINITYHATAIQSKKDIFEEKSLTTRDIIQQNDDKVILIETSNQYGPLSQGSGIAIKEGFFLTNYHVMEGATSAIIKTTTGKQYEIEGIVVYDENKDLAVIKTIEIPSITAVKIDLESDVEKGDTVIAIGSPKGLQNTASEGIISNLWNDDGKNMIQISVPITSGSSGGALFNDKGEVIGVTTSGLEGNALLNFAVSIKHIDSWMKNELNNEFDDVYASFPNNSIPVSTNIDTLDKLKQTIKKNHGVITTSKFSINLTYYDIYEYDGYINIVATIDVEKYSKYLENYEEVESELLEWTDTFGKKLDEYLLGKKALVGIFYQDVYTFYPSFYDADEISVTSDGNFLVTHRIIDMIITETDILSNVRY